MYFFDWRFEWVSENRYLFAVLGDRPKPQKMTTSGK
jgi:hypothetical protein